MLRPHEMSSVIITGPRSIQETIINELHELQVLHIVEHSKNDLADIGIPLESAPKLSDSLLRIRSLISSLGIKKDGSKFEIKKGLAEIDSTSRKLSEELNKYLEDAKTSDESVSKNNLLIQELETLKDVHMPLQHFTNYRSLAYFTGFVKGKDAIAAIKVELDVTTKKFMLLESSSKKKNFIALFADAKSKEHVGQVLKKYSFSQVNFANISNLKGTAANNIKKLEEDNSSLQKNRDAAAEKISRLAKEFRGFLTAAEQFLEIQLEKSEAPLKFASTQSSFLIKGWVPSENLHNTIDRLNKKSHNGIYVHFEPANKHGKAPVKMKNSRLAKPFQFFMDLYSLPSYGEIDPTFFIFLTFPIFFGIMLGDIGYGLVSLAMFWILKRMMPKAKNFFNILMLASFVSILFGFLFGEFFGFEEIGEFHLWHIISRSNDMISLMAIVIVIGVIHVNIGLAVGFVNVLKSHGIMAAIYEKASWIVLELGAAMLALSILKKISFSPWAGAAFLAASVLMLFKGEGIKGIMELPGIFTNILSYARLMAIGVSSVKLAEVINNSASGMFHSGGFLILAGVLILIIGHLINIALGLMGSFLHSLRLHYVEFFSKFFGGGGEKYKPFGIRDEE